MTTITLNVPDEMAGQLVALQDRLPALLYEVLKPKSAPNATPSGATHPAYREMFEFWLRGRRRNRLSGIALQPPYKSE